MTGPACNLDTQTTQEKKDSRPLFRDLHNCGTAMTGDWALLKHALGDTVLNIWMHLCQVRDKSKVGKHSGKVWYSCLGISRKLEIPLPAVKWAFSKLTRLGLLKPLPAEDMFDEPGWRRRGKKQRVYYRIVYGKFVKFMDEGMGIRTNVYVPKATLLAIQKEKSDWGGIRVGQGTFPTNLTNQYRRLRNLMQFKQDPEKIKKVLAEKNPSVSLAEIERLLEGDEKGTKGSLAVLVSGFSPKQDSNLCALSSSILAQNEPFLVPKQEQPFPKQQHPKPETGTVTNNYSRSLIKTLVTNYVVKQSNFEKETSDSVASQPRRVDPLSALLSGNALLARTSESTASVLLGGSAASQVNALSVEDAQEENWNVVVDQEQGEDVNESCVQDKDEGAAQDESEEVAGKNEGCADKKGGAGVVRESRQAAKVGSGAFSDSGFGGFTLEGFLTRQMLNAAFSSFPDVVTLRLPCIPPPPKLPEEVNEVRDGDMLLLAFQTVLEHVIGKEAYIVELHKNGRNQRKRLDPNLAACAALLREHDLAPIPWVAWSFKQWTAISGGKKKRPPLKWVFNASRVSKQHGWCRAETVNFYATRTVFTESAKELLARWYAMRREVVRNPTADIAALSERVFPGGGYAAFLEKSQMDALKTGESIKSKVENGEWVW